MKIAILGYSASGKSTLAGCLARHYGIEALHLDRVQFLPGWQTRPSEEKKQLVAQFMATHAAWVIDGNYSNLERNRRLEEADLIIQMLFPRLSCLHRAWKRYRKYKGTSRPDMSEGCNEKLDAEFIRWILFDGRKKEIRKRYQAEQARYPQKTVVLKNQSDLNRFLNSIKE